MDKERVSVRVLLFFCLALFLLGISWGLQLHTVVAYPALVALLLGMTSMGVLVVANYMRSREGARSGKRGQ